MTINTSPPPLLSVVIPTKNRYATLLPTLEAILRNIDDERLEIVVQDNSDDPAPAREWMEKVRDVRIRYAYIEGALSIVENTEAAFGRVRGEYITFIGDDDLVSPDIMSFVRSFAERGIVSAIYPSAYYWWPSVEFSTPTRYHQPGAFWYPISSTRSEESIDTKAALARVMDEGAVALFDLPRVYHGVVRRSVLDDIQRRTGQIVNGASPDMALAIAASLVVSTHVRLPQPLTVYGASRNSGGGWTAARAHFGRIADQAHLPQRTKDNWSEHLPPIWSEHTIYPQTAIEVMQAMGERREVNYLAFYASMIVNEPHLRSHVTPFAIRFLRTQPSRIVTFSAIAAKKALGRLRRWFRAHISGMPFELSFFDSPDACMKNIAEHPPRA